MMLSEMQFCIVGLGLLGGSYAARLTQLGCRVTAIDRDEAAIAYGIEHGIIAEGGSGCANLLAKADAVVLALYPHDCLAFLRANAQHLKQGALVTDVCGVKANFVHEMQAALRADCELIACHPMAGREVSGVQHANTQMFANANFIITPTEKNTPRGLHFATELGQALGFARISSLSCAAHDEMIGYVSQLTHAIAMSLMNANDNPALAQYTGDSFRDLTRIAKMNDAMWSELFLANAAVLTQEIDGFIAALREVQSAVANGELDTLRTLMQKSTARREQFEKK